MIRENDTIYLTGAGFTAEFDLSNGTGETAEYQRTVLRNSRKKCLLIASQKIGTDSFIKVCSAETFDAIITAMEEKGIDVLVFEEAK